jgi:hypothetical protein
VTRFLVYLQFSDLSSQMRIHDEENINAAIAAAFYDLSPRHLNLLDDARAVAVDDMTVMARP